MKNLDTIHPLVAPYAPGAPYPSMQAALREAAITFCERTRLWRYSYGADIPGDVDYAIVVPAGATMFEIELARFNQDDLIPQSTEWLDVNAHGWRDATLQGKPSWITQTAPDTLRIIPWEAGHLDLALWLKPTEDAAQVPDFMVDKYRRCLADGALAYLLAIPNQPFSDPARAQVFAQTFVGKLDSLMRASSRGQQHARTHTRAYFM